MATLYKHCTASETRRFKKRMCGSSMILPWIEEKIAILHEKLKFKTPACRREPEIRMNAQSQFLMSWDIFTSDSQTDYHSRILCSGISLMCSKLLTFEAKRINLVNNYVHWFFCGHCLSSAKFAHVKLDPLFCVNPVLHFRLKTSIQLNINNVVTRNFPLDWRHEDNADVWPLTAQKQPANKV